MPVAHKQGADRSGSEDLARVQGTASPVAHRNGRNPSASENAGRGEKIAQWAIFEGKPTSGVSPVKLPFRFRFSRWENGGKIQQERSRAPFFLQKGPSCQTFPRNVWQFTPENAPFRMRVPLSAESGQKGAALLDFPPPFIKGGRKFYVRGVASTNFNAASSRIACGGYPAANCCSTPLGILPARFLYPPSRIPNAARLLPCAGILFHHPTGSGISVPRSPAAFPPGQEPVLPAAPR